MNFENIELFVRKKLGEDTSGHDFYHCFRVRTTAEKLAHNEGNVDMTVVICASLLHDVPDVKICKDVEKTKKEIIELLQQSSISSPQIDHVMSIISNLSFKGAGVDTTMPTIEGKIVQDADRLDSIGAIGVARCFAYGGHVGHPIYDPTLKPVLHSSEKEYRKSKGTSISHFYEKLLLLKDRMQTNSGRKVAEIRHQYIESFLNQFLREWNGNDIDETLFQK
ncbi:hypothetical protein M9Y10_020211 [Tritrichomonas musculus]|uniref:HD/PDEase domain-containing protein n=1 Tax=Tritrichomonas musculus TaxID=1915356 RepID=A0ABR2HFL0_9EUKA